MSNSSNPLANPLSKHFRQPAIYLKLPSQGRWYPNGSVDLPVTGEIPVYPMTVKDELTLKTPDALMSGQGMVEVVKSCCPNIKDPWNMPAVDLDPVFIALRLASYGEGMDIKATCPHCRSENEVTVDLRRVLDNVKTTDYSKTSTIDGLVFTFKPQRYQDLNKTNIVTFEEQRLINTVINNDSLSDEEKQRQFAESFEKIRDINIDTVVVSIDSIKLEDGTTVTDYNQIVEYLNHCSRNTYNEIKENVQALIDSNKLDKLHLVCEECNKPFDNSLTFDQSSFFG